MEYVRASQNLGHFGVDIVESELAFESRKNDLAFPALLTELQYVGGFAGADNQLYR